VNTCWSMFLHFFQPAVSVAVKSQHFTLITTSFHQNFSLAFFSLTSFIECCEPLKISHHRVCQIIKIFYMYEMIQRRIASFSVYNLSNASTPKSSYILTSQRGWRIKRDFSPNHKVLFSTSSRRWLFERSTGPQKKTSRDFFFFRCF
jgi:hypothetical protein